MHGLVIAAIVCTGGVFILSDLIFWHKDAQGAIAMILVPIFQVAAIVVLVALVKWLLVKSRV